MTPERWASIQEVFEQALARRADAHAAFLDGACIGDPALRHEVESLLDAFEGTGPFDALASELVTPLAATLQGAPAEGHRIGPYRVLREIGQGGMGTVYLAERADGGFEQQVALKLVRYRTAGEDLLICFLNERQILARSLNNLATSLQRQGDAEAAEPLFREALSIWRKTLGEHPDVARVLNNLASVLESRDRTAEAEALYREALAMKRAVLGADHRSTAVTTGNLARLLMNRGDPSAAEPLYREALRIWQQIYGADHWRLAQAQSALASCLTALQRYEEAEALLLRSYSVLKAQRGTHDKETRMALQHLTALYEAWGKPAQAEAFRTLLTEAESS